MAVENIRISQLAVITEPEIASTDVIVMSDLSAGLSKKLELGTLRSYAFSGSSSIPTASIAISASYASVSNTSTSASYAVTASHVTTTSNSSSYALTASYAPTASWALGVYGGVSTTSASYALSASRSEVTNLAYTLIYTGAHNGTSSAAISSSYSYTASYINIGGNVAVTASWANNVLNSEYALVANEATSAVTAITATRLIDSYEFYGPWTGGLTPGLETLSSTESYIRASASIKANEGSDYAETIFYCRGTVTASFTSSAAVMQPRFIYLGIKNRETEVVTELDRQYFDFRPYSFGTAMNISGSMLCGFNLTASSGSATGSYKVFVSASRGVDIDFNRPPMFTIQTKAQTLTIEDFPS